MEDFIKALKEGKAFDFLANEEGNLSKTEYRNIAKEAIYAAEKIMLTSETKEFHEIMEENLLD